MITKPFIKTIAVLATSAMMMCASANSVGFSSAVYDGANDTVEITVLFDFTDQATFGGGLDLIYDPTSIEYVSYTRGPLPPGAHGPASPVGSLVAPGVYRGFGVGSFDIFSGISGAGPFGTFVFNVLGASDGAATPCGMTLCLQENSIYLFISLYGESIGAELLAAGISGADVALPVPIPAAVWFMLSGVGVLLGFGRKSAEK